MALTSGGDSGKTVVYTDRELSRPLLEHFGDLRDTNLTPCSISTGMLHIA